MIWTHIEDRISRPKKRRICTVCECRIEPGVWCATRTGAVRGEGFIRSYFHPECMNHADEHFNIDDWECAGDTDKLPQFECCTPPQLPIL